MKKLLFIIAIFSVSNLFGNQCPSKQFTGNDFYYYGNYRPLPASASVPSAYAGVQKAVAVRDLDTGRLCNASVTCQYAGYWSIDGIDCHFQAQYCPSTRWTVYDLGGWTPVGGSVTLPDGDVGDMRWFRAFASDGRYCNIGARCIVGNWSPNFSNCR